MDDFKDLSCVTCVPCREDRNVSVRSPKDETTRICHFSIDCLLVSIRGCGLVCWL